MEYGEKVRAAEQLMNHALNLITIYDDPAYGPETDEFDAAISLIREWRNVYGDAGTIEEINQH